MSILKNRQTLRSTAAGAITRVTSATLAAFRFPRCADGFLNALQVVGFTAAILLSAAAPLQADGKPVLPDKIEKPGPKPGSAFRLQNVRVRGPYRPGDLVTVTYDVANISGQ